MNHWVALKKGGAWVRLQFEVDSLHPYRLHIIHDRCASVPRGQCVTAILHNSFDNQINSLYSDKPVHCLKGYIIANISQHQATALKVKEFEFQCDQTKPGIYCPTLGHSVWGRIWFGVSVSPQIHN
jgi:hypothetical protein